MPIDLNTIRPLTADDPISPAGSSAASGIQPQSSISASTQSSIAAPQQQSMAAPAPAAQPQRRMLDLSTAKLSERQGVMGTLAGGLQQTGRMMGLTADALQGDTAEATQTVLDSQKERRDTRLEAFNQQVQRNAKPDDGLWDAIKNVAGAAWDNPAGAGLAAVEQLPNSAAVMGGGYAGFKAGGAAGAAIGSAVPVIGTAAGGTAGAIIGGLAGMFLGNSSIEVGASVMDKGADGQVTAPELDDSLGEGATKAAVITAVDGATLLAGGAISRGMQKTVSRALETATKKTLTDAGIDLTSDVAVRTAMQTPDIAKKVTEAQLAAATAANTLKRRAVEAGTVGTLETLSEGVGEYLGSMAATGEANMTDAVMESLLSMPQSVIETGWNLSQNSAKKMIQPLPTAENPNPAPVEAPDPNNGPVSSAVNNGVQSRAEAEVSPNGRTRPEDIIHTPEPQAEDTPESLQERLKFITQQGSMQGWTDNMIRERERVQGLLAQMTGQPAPASSGQQQPDTLQDQQQGQQSAEDQAPALPDIRERTQQIDFPTVSRSTDLQRMRDVERSIMQSGQDQWVQFPPTVRPGGDVPREAMPQIKPGDRSAMLQFAKARGIESRQGTVAPERLTPLQDAYNPAKVAKAREMTSGRSILIDRNGIIIDGHHQWLAAVADGKPVKVTAMNASWLDMLGALDQFPSASKAPGATTALIEQQPEQQQPETLALPAPEQQAQAQVPDQPAPAAEPEQVQADPAGIERPAAPATRQQLEAFRQALATRARQSGGWNEELMRERVENDRRLSRLSSTDTDIEEAPAEPVPAPAPEPAAEPEPASNDVAEPEMAEGDRKESAPEVVPEKVDPPSSSGNDQAAEDSGTEQVQQQEGQTAELPDGWETNHMKARKAARALGLNPPRDIKKPELQAMIRQALQERGNAGTAPATDNQAEQAPDQVGESTTAEPEASPAPAMEPEPAPAPDPAPVEESASAATENLPADPEPQSIERQQAEEAAAPEYAEQDATQEQTGEDNGRADTAPAAGDPAGVPDVPAGRRDDTQPEDSGVADSPVGDREAGNVPAAEETEPAGADGLRLPAADVEAVEGAGSGGNTVSGQQEDGGAGSVPAGLNPEETSPARNTQNLYIDNPADILGAPGKNGPKKRFERNRAALETFRDITENDRKPTREEQIRMAQYMGWGSFAQEVFGGTFENPQPKEGWEKEAAWLREELGKEGWESARASTVNAHYTSPDIVKLMWDMAGRMGFQGGRVLEPSMGIGNFYGLMPPDMSSRSLLAGIELDTVVGKMAQMLYPDAAIHIKGYEKSKTPDGFYDLIIGNWPFLNVTVPDRRYQKLKPNLHDYFFLKALDQVRPGGLVMGITSAGTMDKKDSRIREEMARKGELLQAIRLPSGTFGPYAGTKVVTDLLIFRKWPEKQTKTPDAPWLTSDPLVVDGQKTDASTNRLFQQNPALVIGKLAYGRGTTSPRPGMIVTPPSNFEGSLDRALSLVPEGAFSADPARANMLSYIANHTVEREGTLVERDGDFWVVRGETLEQANQAAKYQIKDQKKQAVREDQFRRLIDIREKYGALLDAEQAEASESETSDKRAALKTAYLGFKGQHGSLRNSFALDWYRKAEEPSYATLAALESETGTPAEIMDRSTMRGSLDLQNPSVTDAFVMVRNVSVKPTLKEVAELAQKPQDEVRKELIDSGAVFETIDGDIVPSDVYLSEGEIRQRHRDILQAIDEGATHLQRNADALLKQIPEIVPYYNIETQFGASWLPDTVFRQYIGEKLMGMPADQAEQIEIQRRSDTWAVKFGNFPGINANPTARSLTGTDSYRFSDMINAAINNKRVLVKGRDADGNTFVMEDATKAVNSAIANIRLEFAAWLWETPERQEKYEFEYNEAFNSTPTPVYDGRFLNFTGMALKRGNDKFSLRQHQINAIWRGIVNRRSLNAHEVGTGKTYTMAGIAVESRRYGIAKKPLILAHNANSKAVAADIQQMYPSAKVLFIDNMDKNSKAINMRRIANEDWDAIVFPHSMLSKLGMSEETLMDMARDDIHDLEIAAEDAAEEAGISIPDEAWTDEKKLGQVRSATVKNLVKQRMKIIANIQKQAIAATSEDAIAFEDLGIDMVLVDEAHEFKKLPIATPMNMKGLPTDSSARAINLGFITRYLTSTYGGNVHLFTGTPITNTMTEIYNMQRFFMGDIMSAKNLGTWDGWFGAFAREVEDVELNGAGQYESVSRLASFINVPELRRLMGQYMDVVFSDSMPEMQPRQTQSGKTMRNRLSAAERDELENGRTEGAKDRPYKKVLYDTGAMTAEQEGLFNQIQRYAQEFKDADKRQRKMWMNDGDPRSPIIYENRANRISFDARTDRDTELAGMEGQVPDDPGSKISRAIANILNIYREDPKASQVVFSDTGVNTSAERSIGPGQKAKFKVFSPIRDMMARLEQAGIPASEIALVTGGTTAEKKRQIADDVKSGRVRVVFGSSQSLGVGVNMQDNLRAMHHLDAPWRPGDLEQRNGRGHRQGNQYNTVLEYRYLTDRLDGRRWQILAVKQRFINAFMRADGSARVIEGDAAADNGEQDDILEGFSKAAGDPRMLVREKLRRKIESLHERKRLFERGKLKDSKSIETMRGWLAEFESEQAERDALKAEITAWRESIKGDNYSFTTKDGQTFTARKDAQAWYEQQSETLRTEVPREVGTLGGKPVNMVLDHSGTFHLGIKFDNSPERVHTMSLVPFRLEQRAEARLTDMAKEDAQFDSVRQQVEQLASRQDANFTQQRTLDQAEMQLKALETDLADNPVPAPFWLRDGAAVDSEAFIGDRRFVVAGHRWTADGYFILETREDGSTVAHDYEQVVDSQGVRIFEDHDFEAPPTIGEEGGLTEADRVPDPAAVAEANSDEVKNRAVVGPRVANPMPASEVHDIGRAWLDQELQGLPFLQLRVIEQQGELFNDSRQIKAAYLPESGQLVLVAGNLADRNDVLRSMRHEVLAHFGLETLQAEDRQAILNTIMASRNQGITMRRHWEQIQQAYPDLSPAGQAEEVLALVAENTTSRPLQMLLDRIRSTLIRALRRVGLLQRGMVTPVELRQTLRQIAMAAPSRNPASNRMLPKGPMYRVGSYSGPGHFKLLPKKIAQAIGSKSEDWKPSTLALLPFNYLQELAPKGMNAVRDYLKVKRAMEADRNEMHIKYDGHAQKWLKLRGPWWKKNTQARRHEATTNALMYESTRAGIAPYDPQPDPSKARTPKRRAEIEAMREAWQSMQDRWHSLPEDYQNLYRDTRKMYSDHIKEVEEAIISSIENSAQYIERRAERKYREDMRDADHIRDADARDEARQIAEQRRDKTIDNARKGIVSRAKGMRKSFESMRLKGPYFPLRRYGDFFLAARDEKNELASFSLFETHGQMMAAKAQMEKEHPNWFISNGRKSNKNDVRGSVDPAFVAEVQELLGEVPGADVVADAVYQKYLETLPDLSMRRSFIHRKMTAGFDSDALRAFGHTMFHGSYQLARLKYSEEMTDLVEQADEQARRIKDDGAATALANEMRLRHEWVMNPMGGKTAQRLTSFAFTWQLGVSPAAALVNTSQTFMMGAPMIAARFGDKSKVNGYSASLQTTLWELLKASRDFLKSGINKDFLKDGFQLEKALQGEELEAMREFMRIGLIEKTQTHDLSGIGDTGVQYNPVREKVMKYIGFSFHHAERYNREVTSIAAYRIARKAGLSHLEAIDEAAELTWNAHFDYSSGNRARFMQGDIPKILFVFRQHNVNMLSRMALDVRALVKNESPEVRRATIRRMRDMLIMFTVMAGVLGVPAMQTLLAVLDVLDPDDDPYDSEDKLRRWVTEAAGPEVANVVLGGVGAAPGVDLSLTNRVGMGNLWFFSPNQELDGKDAYQYWISQALGAIPSMGENFVVGADQMSQGNVYRGLEKLMPKAIKDVMRATRYGTEGVQTLSEKPVLEADQLSSWNLFAQAMGFTPANVSLTYERNNALMTAEDRIMDQRQLIVNRHSRAVRMGDAEGRKAALEQRRQFNEQYPRVAITFNTLRSSLRSWQNNLNQSEDGIRLNPKLNRQLRDSLGW